MGIISDGAILPYLDHRIGYALMETSQYGEGSVATAGCRDGSMLKATLIALPFYDKLVDIPEMGDCNLIYERHCLRRCNLKNPQQSV